MARKPRIEYEGAFYHVLSRGIYKVNLFLDDGDYKTFLTKLREYKQKYLFKVYAYVLMKNHFHLLIETGSTPLSKIMQGLLQSYTQYFNKKYKRWGHLFQGRYKSIICNKDSYLLELIRYIHLNPARAKIIKNPKDFIWSSHRTYLGISDDGLIDEVEFVLKLFSKSKKKAISLYEGFILEEIGKESSEKFYQSILGDEEFKEELNEKMKQKLDIEKRKVSIDEVVKKICELTGVTKGDILSKKRDEKTIEARRLLVYFCKNYTQITNKEIAGYLTRDEAVVLRCGRAFNEDKMESKRQIEEIKKML
jgi:REP element-mobilizing transposase RayT/predicted house-cleaning noncanonical NTP pyrophosphatase (MazG superfamily)